MRRMRWVVVLVLIATALVGVYGFVPYGPERTVFVEIAPGTGTEGIAGALQQAGIVRNAWAFAAVRVVRGVMGKAGSLKAGEYRFDHPATLVEVYDRLRHGDVYTVTVLVPEGYDIFDVAEAVARAGARSAADAPLPAGSGFESREGFLRAEMEHAELVRAWSPRAPSVEGFLFPDTYRFSRRATAVEMLSAMVKRFGEKAATLGLRPAGVPGRSTAEIVTLASLVEKEVHVDTERPLVAGVFENRLGLGDAAADRSGGGVCKPSAGGVDRSDPSQRAAVRLAVQHLRPCRAAARDRFATRGRRRCGRRCILHRRSTCTLWPTRTGRRGFRRPWPDIRRTCRRIARAKP